MSQTPLHLINFVTQPGGSARGSEGDMVFTVPVFEITGEDKANLRAQIHTAVSHKDRAKAIARMVERAPLMLAFCIDMRTELTGARKAATEAGNMEAAQRCDAMLDILDPIIDYIMHGDA